tara:strand:+ start:485 stop:589 length:105 start_codon:yes stop_codon:yes gene_type:complete
MEKIMKPCNSPIYKKPATKTKPKTKPKAKPKKGY